VGSVGGVLGEEGWWWWLLSRVVECGVLRDMEDVAMGARGGPGEQP
jgi:hypothetical protein